MPKMRASYYQPKFVLIICALLFKFGTLSSQISFDCLDAFQVCSNEPIQVTFETPTYPYSSLELCSFENSISFTTGEFQGIWYKYEFLSGGDFLFDIEPFNMNFDIDFIVFTTSNINCDSLLSVRCMFSGETIGQSQEANAPCKGSTGLAYEAIDVFEDAGCNDGSDNYLAPLQVEAGDIIYLLIIPYSMNPVYYTLSHEGNAELNCTPSNVRDQFPNDFTIFPNPTTNKINVVSPNTQNWEKWIIHNVTGQQVKSGKLNDLTIDGLESLPNGLYILRLMSEDGRIGAGKFIVE